MTAGIGRAEAWAILRDSARAPEGFLACCAAAGTDPDVVVRAAVNVMARRSEVVCPCGWHVANSVPPEGWVCVRYGTRKAKPEAPPPTPRRACELCGWTPAPGNLPCCISAAAGGRWTCLRCHMALASRVPA